MRCERCARAYRSTMARSRGPRECVRSALRRGRGSWLEIVLTEGKNRQVRRMCAAIGHDVLDLVRVRIGGLGLGDLSPGCWRALEPHEILLLARGA